MKNFLSVTSLVTLLALTPALLPAQAERNGVDPADANKPLADQWITYSGDYSGKRFSSLKQVNANTVKHLSLEWLQPNITTACGPTGTAPAGGGGGAAAAPIIIGGLGTGEANNCGPARLGGGILFVDGIIYASSPDNVWAIDARDGAILWHYYWKTRASTPGPASMPRNTAAR